MSNPYAQRHQKGMKSAARKKCFLSNSAIIAIYAFGALVSLVLAFAPSLTVLQTSKCLLLSWILALGALALSVLSDLPETQK